MADQTLRSETNTVTTRIAVLNAACRHLDRRMGQVVAVFEHGQWWVINRITGEQWAVNDAEGPGTTDGFDFELVT